MHWDLRYCIYHLISVIITGNHSALLSGEACSMFVQFFAHTISQFRTIAQSSTKIYNSIQL